MTKDDFSYTSDGFGYKILYKGKIIGGAGIEESSEEIPVRAAARLNYTRNWQN